MTNNARSKVGEVRPSQLIYTYGVGAIVDLPKLSVIVMGLDDWTLDREYVRPIVEDRLLTAVRYRLPEVQRLLAPPVVDDRGSFIDPLGELARLGVPVATFPRWLVCPQCRLLAPLRSGLFRLQVDAFHPERTVYVHENCNQTRRAPEVVPARFLAACENGHLDDFPWVDYVHEGQACNGSQLQLLEMGPSGEARDLFVKCVTCQQTRAMSHAFGVGSRERLPLCRGRRPHLRDFEEEGCEQRIRPIILGASNTWFPVTLSTVAIPVGGDELAQLVDDGWAELQAVSAANIVGFLRTMGRLGNLSRYSDAEIWEAIERHRTRANEGLVVSNLPPDLKTPEWEVFTLHNPSLNGDDFRLQPVATPHAYQPYIRQVVLVERLREVRALVGFSRIDAFGELTDPDIALPLEAAPLSRHNPTWAPASEVRGEGIFIEFEEARLQAWLQQRAVQDRSAAFFEAHRQWRQARHIEPADEGFPGMRYVLIHTFAHALMRQLALECGYAAASIRERVYARAAQSERPATAGVLLYTSAPDSEGTLGGLVRLGQSAELERHIANALEGARLCASDPLCAEHAPSQSGRTLHAAACHACILAPETSCERGNKYLDRSVLAPTIAHSDLAFFALP